MSHFSTFSAEITHIGPYEPMLRELRVFIEYAVGPAAAIVRITELRALARAKPTIAHSFLTEELRRWRTWTGAINPADRSLI
jgi:hypothetical protein